MTDHDPIEAVIQALERQMSKSVGAEHLRPEPIIEVTRGFLHGDVAQNVKIENPSQATRTNDSLIKARYASTVLRVAQTCDNNTAARLVGGLTRDLPLPNELPEIVDIHIRAIDSFIKLSASLGDATNSERQRPWKAAVGASADWLRAVKAQQ